MNTTVPGSSAVEFVAPPPKFHRNVSGRLLSESVPVPVKLTLWPATIVTLLVGVLMVPFGAELFVEPRNSKAPRSAKLTDPVPVFGTPFVLTRDWLSASSDGQFGEPELAASIAGEPEPRWKLPFAGLTNSGFDCSVFASLPLAAA